MYTIQMIMTHLTVNGNTVLADIMVGRADNMENAEIVKQMYDHETPPHSITCRQIRHAIYQMNPQAGSVRTEFVIRSVA